MSKHAQARFFNAHNGQQTPCALLTVRTEQVDGLVASAAADCLGGGRFAVAAVGGYGRRELFPHSDVDLLLLAKHEADLCGGKTRIADFVGALWDRDVRVSHSARTVEECGRVQAGNAELHISLLDVRFVCGAREIFDELAGRLPEVFHRDAGTLTRRLVELARHRHAKFNNTIHHLEPNIKETPGGIRDVHLLRWLSRLAPQHEPIRESIVELEPALEFLYSLRCFLHVRAGRDNNLLSFEMQDEAARDLACEPLAPEAWMRVYFQNARRVFHASVQAVEYTEAQDGSLLRHFRDWRSRLSTAEFTVSRERVFLRNAGQTLSSAESVLRVFAFAGRHGLRLAWDTHRRLRSEMDGLARLFRDQTPGWDAWRDLLSQPQTGLALEQMQETGLLAIAIPEWQTIDSLVVRDFYHRYTVDEHTIVAIRMMDDLAAQKAGTPERLHDFTLDEEDRTIVRLALLLHDLGKGTKPGDHVAGSEASAQAFLLRVQAPEAIQRAVLFLIRHHLDLSLVMNGRDLDDPATARFLTARVGTQEDLRRLTLLTYADIAAVNPTAMTPWRLEQLWRVYSLSIEQLTRELDADRIHNVVLSDGVDGLTAEQTAFLNGLPKRYLRTHTPEQMEHHYGLELQRQREGVAVAISREAGAYAVTVVARDERGLFARLCGALASFGMNIVKAEAASNAAGCVLDVVRFTDPMRTLELNPGEVSRLQWTVECAVRGSIHVPDLLKRRRRVPRSISHARVKPAVRFHQEASDRSTLIEFAGEDRPGLLYDLVSSITAAECDIEIVMIDTEAHRAFDVFYVTCGGCKLTGEMERQLEADLIRAAGGG